jgi:cysteine desulfurase / selenocysteine lyase
MNKQPPFNSLDGMSGQDMMQQLANKIYREGIADHQPAFPLQHKGEEQPISSPHFSGIVQPGFEDSVSNGMSAGHRQTGRGVSSDIALPSQHIPLEQMLPQMDFYFLKAPEQTEAFISTEKIKDFYSRCYTTQERGKYYFEPMGAEPAVKPANAHNGKKGNRDWSRYRMFHPEAVRRDFPALQQTVNGKPLVWLDNAATTHKPQSVIDALARFYERDYSNIHRGAHTLAARATDAYEAARDKIRHFIGAGSKQEIVLVRGTTEGINLIANTFGRQRISPGDEIILSELEHHANIVPWQMLARERGAHLRVIPVNNEGDLMLGEYERLFSPRTRLVAVGHVSNALGTVVPLADMIATAHRRGIPFVVDGAQSVQHIPIDVQALDADFFVFSGHKLFAPTGIGAVYGKLEYLEQMIPWQGGGNMIDQVSFEETTFNVVPARFEAGTPSIGDAVGLGAAIDYVQGIGLENIHRYENELMEYLVASLRNIPGLQLIGNPRNRAGALSFIMPRYQTQQIGQLLDKEGIAVRAGHHCAQPALRRFGLSSSVRPSLAFYNTTEDIDRLREAVLRLAK